MRQTNSAGIALIKKHEGLKLEASVTPEGQVTIGYGHSGRGLEVGKQIDEEEADRLLASDLAWLEESVMDRVRVELTDNEFSALVSLAFAIGIHRFSKSTLLKLLNNGEKLRAADAIMWLGQPDEYGSQSVIAVISNQRRDEKILFLDASDNARQH